MPGRRRAPADRLRPDHAGGGTLTQGSAAEAGPRAGLAPVRPGLFTDGDEPRLLGSRCALCGRLQFPAHDDCTYCGAPDAQEVELSAQGRLWAWTAVTSPPPGYSGPVPYGFGVVELDDGVRVVTRLTESDPGALRAGQPMRLVLEAIEGGGDEPVVVYAFAPADTT